MVGSTSPKRRQWLAELSLKL